MLENGRGPYRDGQVQFTEGVFAPILGRRVPIHVGGVSMPAYRRAARLGDGWQGLEPDPRDFVESVNTIRSLTDRTLIMSTRARWSGTANSLDEMVAHVEGLREVGADYLAIWFGEWDRVGERMLALSEAVGFA
jgi:hypothetical protein